MSFVAGAITGNLILNTSGFTGGIAAAISAASSGAGGISGPLIGAASAIADAFKEAFSAIKDSVMEVGQHFHEIGAEAGKIGVSTEFLSQMGVAAKASGSSMQALADGMKFLNKNMSEAAAGDDSAAGAFAKIGISANEVSQGLGNTEEMFRRVVEQISGLSNSADKTSAAMNLLGRGGSDLLPLNNQGAAGLDKWATIADRTNATVGDGAAKSGEKFGELSTVIGSAWEGIKAAFAEPILQALGDNAGDLEGIVFSIVDFVKGAVPPILSAVIGGVQGIVTALHIAFDILTAIDRVLLKVTDAIGLTSGDMSKWINDTDAGFDKFNQKLSNIQQKIGTVHVKQDGSAAGGTGGAGGNTYHVHVGAGIDTRDASSQIAGKIQPELSRIAETQTKDLQGAARRALVAGKTGGRAAS